jgi:hypothetical protein
MMLRSNPSLTLGILIQIETIYTVTHLIVDKNLAEQRQQQYKILCLR